MMEIQGQTIRGDLHVHSSHQGCATHRSGDPLVYGSDCGERALAEASAYAANNPGLEYVALVNHASDPRAPSPLKPNERSLLTAHVRAIAKQNAGRGGKGSSAILAGVEASILPNGSLDVDDELLQSLDVVIASRQSLAGDASAPAIRDAILAVIRSHPIHIIGHPTKNVTMLTPGDWEKIVIAAGDADVAIELNVKGPFDQALMTIVAHYGVKVSFGLDVHVVVNPADISLLGPYQFRPQLLVEHILANGIDPAQVLNTYSLAKLRTWLHRNAKNTKKD